MSWNIPECVQDRNTNTHILVGFMTLWFNDDINITNNAKDT